MASAKERTIITLQREVEEMEAANSYPSCIRFYANYYGGSIMGIDYSSSMKKGK